MPIFALPANLFTLYHTKLSILVTFAVEAVVEVLEMVALTRPPGDLTNLNP